jgi:hypothetical protein
LRTRETVMEPTPATRATSRMVALPGRVAASRVFFGNPDKLLLHQPGAKEYKRFFRIVTQPNQALTENRGHRAPGTLPRGEFLEVCG